MFIDTLASRKIPNKYTFGELVDWKWLIFQLAKITSWMSLNELVPGPFIGCDSEFFVVPTKAQLFTEEFVVKKEGSDLILLVLDLFVIEF
jgi:hypothetical protein